MIDLTVDKEFTTLSNLDMVERHIKEFMEKHSPQDVLDEFLRSVPEVKKYINEAKAISYFGNAYSSDVGADRKTNFQLTLVLKDFSAFFEICFWMDSNGEIRKFYGSEEEQLLAYGIYKYSYSTKLI